jgi:hypothetical protein
VRGRDLAQAQFSGSELLALEDVHALKGKSAGTRMNFEHAPVAHQQRPTARADLRIKRGLERDLRADSRGIAKRDRHSWQAHVSP